MPKCDFNKVTKQIALRHGYSPVNSLHIFRIPFLNNTSGRLLLEDFFMLLILRKILRGGTQFSSITGLIDLLLNFLKER